MGPPLDRRPACARRRYLSSVPTAMPRCRQNASRFNPAASNSATSASASARLRRLRTAPNSLMNQVQHESLLHNRVRYSDGYAKSPLQLKQCPRKILDHDPKHYRLGPVASSTYPYPMMRRTRYACSAAHCPEGRSPAEAGAACALTVDDVAQTDSVVQLLPNSPWCKQLNSRRSGIWV